VCYLSEGKNIFAEEENNKREKCDWTSVCKDRIVHDNELSHESSRARTLLSLKSLVLVATMATTTSTDMSTRTGVREFIILIAFVLESSVDAK
jgi:hypothetical protein